MSSSWKEAFQAKYLSEEKMRNTLAAIRKEKKTIVTLNGCFDLLHAGHLEMLYEASNQGDYLLVALNSDASVKQNKGEGRPILPLEARMQLLAALSFVSYVTSFSEKTPCTLLQKICPDVHVNGREYGENCVEAEIVKEGGGRLHLVSLIPGLSTTEIITKIVRTNRKDTDSMLYSSP